MKKWLVCNLDDEHYTQSYYTLHNTLCDAMRWCELGIEPIDVSLYMHLEKVEDVEMFRYDYSYPDDNSSFIVNFIMEIDINPGDYICIWYHAYEGVDFKLLHQGTLDECFEARTKYLNNISCTVENNYPEQIVIDTGNEWEIIDIRKCIVDLNGRMYFSSILYDYSCKS